jgi:hypothetical protein
MHDSKLALIMSALRERFGKAAQDATDPACLASKQDRQRRPAGHGVFLARRCAIDSVDSIEVTDIFGHERIDTFAAEIGVDATTAVE